MKRERRKSGSITLPIILLCASFISFAVVIINFSRIHSAHLRLETVCDFVSDSILSKYDSYLYDEYRIMGVKKEENLQANLRDMAIRCLKYENASFDFYGFKDVELDVKALSDFSNIESFKTAIINAHRDEFLVENAQRAVSLIKFWKLFMDGKNLSDLQVEAMKYMGELQKQYDECVEISKNIEKIYKELKQGGEDISSHEMILLAYEYKSIQNSTDSEDEKRKEEIEAIFKNLNSLIKEMKKLSDKLKAFKQNCERAISSFDDVTDRLKDKKEKVGDEEFKNVADEMIKEIEKNKIGVLSAIEKCSAINVNLENANRKMANLNRDVKRVKSGGEVEHQQFDMGEVMEDCKLHFDIFESSKEEEVDAKKVLQFMWKVLTGGLLPDYSRFDLAIDDESYLNLPSVKAFKTGEEELKSPSGKGGSYGKMCQEAIDHYSKNSDMKEDIYLYLSDGNRFENIIDKMSISDFALEYFDYDVYEKEPQKISDISKNPLYQSEVEYLLHGNKSPKFNMMLTDMQIWAIRNAANSISLLIHKRVQLHSISSAISCVTLGVGYPLIYGVVTFGWSSLESLCDLRELHRGNAVAIFKGKEDFFISMSAENIERMIEEIEESGLKGVYTGDSKVKTKELKGLDKSKIHLDYGDYLFILLCFSDEDTLLYRLQDVIEIRGLLKDKNFSICDYEVMYEVNVRSRLPLIYSDILDTQIISRSIAGF